MPHVRHQNEDSACLEKPSSGGDEDGDDLMAWRTVRRGFLVVNCSVGELLTFQILEVARLVTE
jgi:hypothetical protein